MKSYEQELSEVLAMMAATLKNVSGDKKGLAQAWLMVLSKEVPQEWLGPTCGWFLKHAVFFPAPSEFIQKATEIQAHSEMEARLAITMRHLKEHEALAIEDRRARNIAAGIDPDEPLSIDALAPII